MKKYAPNSAGMLVLLTQWLRDPEISEVLLNKPGEIYVEKNNQFIKYYLPEFNRDFCETLFQLIAGENQQALNEKFPLLSGNLLNGFRIQLILPPAAQHPTFAIRCQKKKIFTLESNRDTNFYKNAMAVDESSSTLSLEKSLLEFYENCRWYEFISQAIAMRKNIVISGGTSTGKTTFLNACLHHINLQERIITLEDTREIHAPHDNQVNLIASKGTQSLAKLSMQDLLQCSLRLRPDRIILGEIRGKEIMDFVAACSTGHEGSLTTVHANNPQMALMRMKQMYKLNQVPAMTEADILEELNAVIDIVIQLTKTSNGRCIQSVYYNAKNYR